ncbi:MAG: 5'-nucleotidase C-terminal domain-containing protein [Candidatus Gastranaerophilales bacterium]|nr:5'-nucleotidase C-terminal domain-containing protein [Candidatus Gastranaerophilales bacterium]
MGELELDFDDNGVLIEKNCKNKIIKLKETIPVHRKEDAIYILSAPAVEGDALQGHSETGNIVADSNLWYVNKHTKGKKADFAFVNAGTLRGEFNDIYVNASDVQSIVPFTSSTLIKTDLSKKQIIDSLNWSAKSTSFKKVVPGMMQVANMEYTVNPDLTVSDVHILDDKGNIKYNLDDYEDDKTFTAVYDLFLATGPVGLTELKKDCNDKNSVENFDASRQDALTEYLQENSKIKEYHKERIHKK